MQKDSCTLARMQDMTYLGQHSKHGHLADSLALVFSHLALVALLEGDIHRPVHHPQLTRCHCSHCGCPWGRIQQSQLSKGAAVM